MARLLVLIRWSSSTRPFDAPKSSPLSSVTNASTSSERDTVAKELRLFENRLMLAWYHSSLLSSHWYNVYAESTAKARKGQMKLTCETGLLYSVDCPPLSAQGSPNAGQGSPYSRGPLTSKQAARDVAHPDRTLDIISLVVTPFA